MAKIETTTKAFREGITLSGPTGDEVRWESTGHLSVRLLDASGAHPVVARAVRVDIPGEGTVELESDARGVIFHPDVPFQDYELDLGDQVKVHAPAVANRDDVQDRHVPGVAFAFVRLLVRDADGFPRAEATLALEGPDGATLEVETDAHGCATHAGALAPGTYKITNDTGVAEVVLPDHGEGLIFVTLIEEAR